jgi:hypothetical protein
MEAKEQLAEIKNSPEWISLKHSPVLLPYLRATVQAHQDLWAQWEYDSDDPALAAKNNYKALGIVGWIQRFISEIEDLGAQPPQEQPQQELLGDEE